MLGENPQTIRENTGILLEASKEIGLEVNPEKTKYMIMSRDQNIVRNGNIKIGNLSFEEVEKFKYVGATVTNINDTREHRLRVFENEVLRKIFGAKRDEVTGEWRKLHNAELHALYSSPDIIRNIKSRRLRWAGHVARMGESRNVYRVLVGRPEGKRPLGRPRRRWEDNIKMDLREVGYDGRDWINLAQDRDQWWAYVRAAMNLRAVAKQAASTATQCIAAAQGAAQHNSNKASQEQLSCDCKAMANMIKDLVEGIKGTLSKPDNPAAQLTLINASEQFLQPGARVVQSASAVLPTVADQAAAQQLNTSAQQLSAALSDLRSTLNRAREVCGSLELDSASELIHNLQADLEAFQRSAERNELGPLPGETTESAALKLGSTSKNVDSAMSHLLSAAVQGNENYTRIAARNTWSALRDFTTSVRGVAATTHDQDTQKMILASAMEVMEQSLQLIEEVRQAMQGKGNPVNAQKLTYASKNVSQALNKCVGSLPGQKDVEEAIQSIANALQILDRDEFPPSSKPCGQLQQELSLSAASLNDASAALVSSVHNPTQLAVSSRTFDTAFRDLLGRSTEVAGQTKDKEMQGQMMVSLKNVFLVSSKLLATAKSVAADPSAPNAKNQLAEAARAVTDSINHLIDVCTLASPGQKECDNAIREIHSLRPLLDSPTEPHNDFTYFECLDTITEKAKSLGDGMAGIANHAKKSELEELGRAVKMVSNAVCTLVEATAQAAHLVGVSDPSSVAARPGLVDQAQFARAAQAIHTACQHLTNQQQALTAATVIAKHASALCNACRTASSKTTNPVAKRHFLQAAKDVANCTSDLVEKIKALDKEFSDHNRENCTSAMKPLLDAVDDLCTFGGYPEFASQPAKISAEAQLAQEPILESGRTIIHDSCSIMQVVKSLAVTPRDSPTWQQLANHSKGVSESIKKLVTSIRDKAPGQKDCDEAIEKLSALIRVLDQASLAAVSQSLSPRRDHNLQGFTEQTQSSSREIEERLESVRTAGKFEAENICHAVNQMVLYFEPLVAGAIGAASNMVHSKQQMELLDQTKTVTECALQLVVATKEGGGNRKAVHIHPGIDEAVDATRNALKDVGVTLEHLATQAGMVTGILDSITRAMTRVTNNSRRLSTHSENEELSFVDYQTRMVVASKEVARTAQDMAVKCAIDPGRLGALSAELSRLYVQLATDATGAAAATPNAEVAARILSGIQELGRACQEVVKLGSTCQVAQKEVADSARHVSQKVSQVLVALQAGSRGTQACINASGTVSGIIGDLDATVMVAMAGTLNAENEDESFVDHRDKIIKMAGMLAKDTNSLVTGAVSSQEQLAVAAQNTVSTIVQLAEFVKFGAASLGPNNPDAQVMLINAVKDVSSALSDLILATKTASGKNVNDPSMNHLKDSEKIMMTSITSLLKTVKAVEDEHTRGRCALESTIEAITQEIRILQSPEQQKIHATPEELVRCTKVITVATAKAVAASSSGKQDDIIAAANMGRKAMSDMLTICKATANSADGEKLRMRTLQAGNGVAVQYRELLQIILQIVTRPGGATDAKQNLSSVSRNIAQCITELVTSAELLKGSNWEDPDDPTVIAENELLGAAASIEAAAKKLASLRPRRQMQEVDESLNFDEMILEAAKSIATANSALLRAATAAQRELVEQGKVSRSPLTSSDDGQWSEGLISAARLVAAATHSLVESANSLVQGMACEDMLISSAKKVASSTAQLILACKVKADPDADSTKRLQSAGNAVKRATDSLVKAAQQAMKQEEQRSLVLDTGMVPRIKQEMNALADVLRIERELEDARNRLTAIRQAKYKSKPES
ncbi:hypothetical protein ANN_12257 [Periplaneta americana]|uniref:I/LWEQ domain-containing protein n=1 Tax=Periplaneta americana TaxID=6978 RepID=A0ABQ8TI05_PERAM|nr:hypothetical protein ANN_12257 [Periplaneta americana]